MRVEGLGFRVLRVLKTLKTLNPKPSTLSPQTLDLGPRFGCGALSWPRQCKATVASLSGDVPGFWLSG